LQNDKKLGSGSRADSIAAIAIEKFKGKFLFRKHLFSKSARNFPLVLPEFEDRGKPKIENLLTLFKNLEGLKRTRFRKKMNI
jgi:hypothetical protein